MRKKWGTLRAFFIILLILCVTSIGYGQQSSTGSPVLQYTETIDLRELSKNINNLTTNIGKLTENQKELTESVKTLTKSMNDFNVRISVIEERTAGLKTIQNIILVAIIGAIITPIILHILSNKNKKNEQTLEHIQEQDTLHDKDENKTEFDLHYEGGTS